MEIALETKLQVNSYMMKNFTNKGIIGYHYLKRILECMLQQYKNESYIEHPSLNKLKKLANIEVSYGAVQRAINYFLTTEKIESNFSNFVIDTLEKIINENQPKFNTPNIDYEEEF